MNLPTSVALPFGSFDAVLADPLNKVSLKFSLPLSFSPSL